MLPTAQSHIAGERKRSRWAKARLSLLMPIGAIVAVAIVCVVVAVLTSARRADEVSAGREQSLLETAIAGKGMRLIRELDSAAATEQATSNIRNAYDSQWVSRRAQWLIDYYNEDVVAVVDGNDRITYTLFRAPADAAAVDLGAQIASTLDLLRGRLNAVPEHAVAVIAKQDPAKPGRHTALIQRFMDRPAIVGAVAVGTETDLIAGNARAPIVVAVRYIDAAMLKEISGHLLLTNLRKIDEPAPPADEHASNSPTRKATPLPASPGSRRGPAARSSAASCRSSRWRSAALRSSSASCCATCGVAPRRSGPANRNCAIWRCTIRSAACPTASISASGSKP